MSHSIAIPHHRPVEHERGRRHGLLVGAMLGLIVAALAFAIVESTVRLVTSAPPAEAIIVESLAEPPRRELAREWLWEPKIIEFEHMYHQKKSRRPDWIRRSGGR